MKALLSIALFASTAVAQPASPPVGRVLSFSTTNTSTETMKQTVNILRTIVELQAEQISLDQSLRTITVRTNSALADMAEWIFDLLDDPGASPGVHEYIVPASSDDVVRVSYVLRAGDPQELREVVNTIRSLAEVQRIVTFFPQKALVWRGKSWQAGLSEWLISQEENPPVGQSPAVYSVAGVTPNYKGIDDPAAVRVYHLPSATTAQALQAIVSAIQTRLQVQRITACTGPRVIALRASPIRSDAEIDIDCQVLMRPEIIDDTLPPFAEDHIRIEAPNALRVKCSNPRDGLSAQRINIRVIGYLKRDLPAALRKHNAPPCPEA